MSNSGHSIDQDTEYRQFQPLQPATAAATPITTNPESAVLLRREQQRAEFRHQMGIPEPIEESPSFFRRILGRKPKRNSHNQWLDSQLVKKMSVDFGNGGAADDDEEGVSRMNVAKM